MATPLRGLISVLVFHSECLCLPVRLSLRFLPLGTSRVFDVRCRGLGSDQLGLSLPSPPRYYTCGMGMNILHTRRRDSFFLQSWGQGVRGSRVQPLCQCHLSNLPRSDQIRPRTMKGPLLCACVYVVTMVGLCVGLSQALLRTRSSKALPDAPDYASKSSWHSLPEVREVCAR